MSDITVEIVDVGLRDGLQNDPAMMNTEGKLEFINRLLDAGVKRMEVASFRQSQESAANGGFDRAHGLGPARQRRQIYRLGAE